MLTQIITHNNEKTIKVTLDSIKKYLPESKIIILDLGSKDRTLNICSGLEIKSFVLTAYDEIRNSVLDKSDWHFYINPGEKLLKRFNFNNKPMFFSIINGDMITKEVRFFHNSSKFENPVFEFINDDKAIDSESYILSSGPDYVDRFNLLTKYKQSLSSEYDYYEAFYHLSIKNYKQFINCCEKYFLNDSKSISSVMIRYYYSGINSYIYKNSSLSTRCLVTCLVANPLMSEFWCLLGDIFYHNIKNYSKAKIFYENAIILGSRRPKSDRYPMQISKYKDYPNKMIKSCEDLIKNTKLFNSLIT